MNVIAAGMIIVTNMAIRELEYAVNVWMKFMRLIEEGDKHYENMDCCIP